MLFQENGKPGFLWGVATSSYQVEGGIPNNDWHYYTNSSLIKNRIFAITSPSIFYRSKQVILHPAGDAVKEWSSEYFEKDFELAKGLGMNAFRISLEWSRIEPKKDHWNQNAINHYKDMLKSMRNKGLNPVVTLNHFTLPLWVLTPPSEYSKIAAQELLPSPLKYMPFGEPLLTDPYWTSLRGWENCITVEKFIEYVRKVVFELRQYVDYWITVNEPIASIIGLGYLAGIWPPGFAFHGKRAQSVLHNLIEAHVRAYDVITSLDNIDADGDGITKQVGFSHYMMAVEPAEPLRILGLPIVDNTESALNFDYFVNDYFLNAVVNGKEDLNYLNTLQKHNKSSPSFIIHDKWKDKIDFVGLNYYRRVYVYYHPVFDSNIAAILKPVLDLSSTRFIGGAFTNDLYQDINQPHSILSDLGWEIYPEGLYKFIMRIKNQWNKPVLITENGIADKNAKYRAPFIVAHLQQVKRAIDDGADIIGYLHWSLVDNYEWHENMLLQQGLDYFMLIAAQVNLIRCQLREPKR